MSSFDFDAPILSASAFEDEDARPQSTTSNTLVRVYVGSEEKHYVIHRYLLMTGEYPPLVDSSPNHESTLFLESHDPSSFEVLFDWLYTGKINIDTKEGPEHLTRHYESQILLYKISLLATECGFIKLINHCLDIYVHLSELGGHILNGKVASLFLNSPASHRTLNCRFPKLMLATAVHELKNTDTSICSEVLRFMKKFHIAEEFLEELIAPGSHIKIDQISKAKQECYNPSNLKACDYHNHNSLDEMECFSVGLTFKESYLKRLDAGNGEETEPTESPQSRKRHRSK